MATLSHRIEYAAALLGTWIANQLSDRSADRFGAGLGSFIHALWKSRRRIAHDNLKQAFGDFYSEKEIDVIVKNVFRNIGRTLVEFARFKSIGREGVRKIVAADCQPLLQRILDEGKGGVFLTAHFGNWELLGSWAAAVGFPVDFLTGEQHNLLVDNLLNGFRKEMGVGMIPLRTSIRGIFKSLKDNHFTGMVADQHAGGGYVEIDFFGRKAAAPKGPAAFAIKSGAPLIPVLMRRERYDRHVIMMGTPIYPSPNENEEEEIRSMTILYTRFFEESIRAYPDQWMWTHRRWKLAAKRNFPPS
jgi:KDO2-lipid IV(A) lauroyltransferase